MGQASRALTARLRNVIMPNITTQSRTTSEEAIRRAWDAHRGYYKSIFGEGYYPAFRQQYLQSQGATLQTDPSAPGGDSVNAPPGDTDIIDTGDETIISGLPLFNQALRNMISQIFTGALGTASRDVSQGATGNQVLGGNPNDMFASWLPQALKTLGIPKNKSTNPNAPPTQPEPQGDVMSSPGGGSDAVIEQLLPLLNQSQPTPMQPQTPTPVTPPPTGGGALGGPAPMGDTGGGDMISTLFNTLLGGRDSPAQRRPTVAASPGLGEVAMIAQLAKSLFGGQPEQPAQFGSQNQPFEPSFESPNSLQSFIQLLQLFGPGSNSPLGASPGMGFKTRYGASPGLGDTGPEMADNPLTNIMSAFSLPSYQGPFSQTATPLQREATDFASQSLRSNPMTDPNFNNSLQEMYTTGGRFDNSDQFAALEQITNRRMEEGNAGINEMFGSNGLRYGSDVAKGRAGLTSELLAQESLQRAQIAQQSYEAAANRRLSALGLAPQISSQNMGNAQTAMNIGEQDRQIGDSGIQRQMAEFARTQGGLFPLLLQFALAGTEGDTVVLE